MATNPWTCLPTHARTLCRRAVHAASAVALCLGLTTTAASAAGGGDAEPLAEFAIELSVEQRAMLDAMAFDAEAILAAAIGEAPAHAFAPIRGHWAYDADDRRSFDGLFEADPNESLAFIIGSVRGESGMIHGVSFHPDGPPSMVWDEAELLEMMGKDLSEAGADGRPSTPRMGIVTGTLVGEFDHVEQARMLWLNGYDLSGDRPAGEFVLIPIGAGPEEEMQEVVQDLAVLPLLVPLCKAACAPAGVAIVTIVAGHYWAKSDSRESCRKKYQAAEDYCKSNYCGLNVYAHCINFVFYYDRYLGEIPMVGPGCTPQMAANLRRCLACCERVREQWEDECDTDPLNTTTLPARDFKGCERFNPGTAP